MKKKVKPRIENQLVLQLEDMMASTALHCPLDKHGMQELRDRVRLHLHGTRGRHAANKPEKQPERPAPGRAIDMPPPIGPGRRHNHYHAIRPMTPGMDP